MLLLSPTLKIKWHFFHFSLSMKQDWQLGIQVLFYRGGVLITPKVAKDTMGGN